MGHQRVIPEVESAFLVGVDFIARANSFYHHMLGYGMTIDTDRGPC
jgi:hypothetical protein